MAKPQSAPTNALTKISSPPDLSETERLARQWAATFAELFQVRLSDRGPRFVDLWVSALADLHPEAFNEACRRAMQVCKFFPTPAEIRGLITEANANGLQLRAEHQWQHFLAWLREWYHPNIDLSHRWPELPAAVIHAARAAGGFNLIWGCTANELQWAKKRFIEDYIRIHETGRDELLLTDGQARDLLKRIVARTGRNQAPSLPAAKTSTDGSKKTNANSGQTDTKPSPTRSNDSRVKNCVEDIQRQKEILAAKGYLPANEKKIA